MDTTPTPAPTTSVCLERLRAALGAHGITLPSLGLDPLTPDHLIALGNCNADTAQALAKALNSGAGTRR
ncbi:hypothetical protein ACX6XY_28365 [Streptomyces sp. O3]